MQCPGISCQAVYQPQPNGMFVVCPFCFTIGVVHNGKLRAYMNGDPAGPLPGQVGAARSQGQAAARAEQDPAKRPAAAWAAMHSFAAAQRDAVAIANSCPTWQPKDDVAVLTAGAPPRAITGPTTG